MYVTKRKGHKPLNLDHRDPIHCLHDRNPVHFEPEHSLIQIFAELQISIINFKVQWQTAASCNLPQITRGHNIFNKMHMIHVI